MRKLFWLLLLGNAVLFAVIQRGWWVPGEQEQQLGPALRGETIRLLDVSQRESNNALPSHTRALVPESATVQVPASHPPSSSLQLALNLSDKAKVASNTLVCLEWGDFSGPDLARSATALSAMQLGDKLSQRQIERDIGYLVYIPPLKNKTAINQKVAELKELGISEYFIIQGAGSWHNAISLGVFKTREAAQNFLDYLRTKGVRTAKVGERASKLKATIYKLNKVDAATVVKLTALQKEFSGSELKNVPCTLTR
jgi:hypothetical protein